MPKAPARPCRYPGCPGFCKPGEVFCEQHLAWSTERVRGGGSARGYGVKWREVRILYLQRHPLCVECLRKGKLTPATVVDHIIPHRGDQRLFWDVNNWQALCKNCHDQKTGRGE